MAPAQTRPTDETIRQWAELAFMRWRQFDVGDLVSEFYDTRGGLIERWACNDGDCPARPEWDRGLTEEFDVLCKQLERQIEAVALRTMTRSLAAFLDAHPETPINPEAASAERVAKIRAGVDPDDKGTGNA